MFTCSLLSAKKLICFTFNHLIDMHVRNQLFESTDGRTYMYNLHQKQLNEIGSGYKHA